MLELTAYLDIERALGQRLVQAWRPVAALAYADMRDKVASRDFAGAQGIAHQLDLVPVVASNREWIKYNLYAAARFGAMMANPTGRLALTVGAFEQTLNKVADQFHLYASNAGNARLQHHALQSIANAEEQSRVKKDAVASLDTPDQTDTPRFVKDFVSFANTGDKALQLVSALNTSRLSAWGFVAEAQVLGITEYKLVAVLDNRTSNFCRHVANGRTFKVADAADKLNDALSATNPDDLREIQPWPDQDDASIADYQSMSNSDLMELGLLVPPFHPWCRTLLARVGHSYRIGTLDEVGQVVDETDDEQPEDDTSDITDQSDAEDAMDADVGATPDSMDEPATPETFAELGIDATPDEVQYWNDYVGMSPFALFALLDDVDPQSIFDQMVDSGVTIDPDNAEITTTVSGPLAGDGSQVNVQHVLDPVTGSLYLDYAEFEQAHPDDGEAYLRTMYAGMVDGADAVDAADITVNTPPGTASDHALAGMTPSQTDWDLFREQALNDLSASGNLSEIVEALDETEMEPVVALLQSSDPAAAVALAQLPYEVDGKALADVLFQDVSWAMTLNLTDPAARARFSVYYPT